MTFTSTKSVNSISIDTAVSAGNLKIGETKTLHGLFEVGEFNNYYKLTLESKGILEVHLACTYPNVDFQVLDKNRNFVGGSCEGGISKESLTRVINAGDLYIWVYCIAGAAANYSLTLRASEVKEVANSSSRFVKYKLKDLEFSEILD